MTPQSHKLRITAWRPATQAGAWLLRTPAAWRPFQSWAGARLTACGFMAAPAAS